LYLLLSLLSLIITTVLSDTVNSESGEIAHNRTSTNSDKGDIIVYYFQPANEWKKLKAVFTFSAVAGCVAFVSLCCICGLNAAMRKNYNGRRKYISHA
ncbi:hypothetical protein PFISCL1PPCAC_5752, partial [Pristionchus fissidentatus]